MPKLAGSAVDVSPMTHLDHVNRRALVIDREDDSEGTDADAVKIIGASKLLAAGRARLNAKLTDAFDQPGAILLLVDGLEFLGGAALDEDAIACHAASTP